jgi:HD-like signal output (HDOD) protein
MDRTDHGRSRGGAIHYSSRLQPPILDCVFHSPALPQDPMIDQLTAEIASRIDVIEASLSPQERTSDTIRFLRAVKESPANSIKQAPQAAQRALAKTRNPDIAMAELVRVVEEDPTLGQALLRYANSAYYSTGSAVVSLRHAAQRVGSSGVHNVVLGVMLEGMLCKPGGEYQKMVVQVREHLVRTAPIARAMGRGFGLVPDECFSLALLHDAGKLIVFDVIGALRHETRRDVNVPRGVVSRVLRELHEPLGGIAVLHWGLGDAVAASISTHHRQPIPATEDRMSEVLFVAERAEHSLSGVIPRDVEGWWREGAISGDAARVEELLSAYMERELAA